MAATGLDGTSIQFSCTESTRTVSMHRIDTISLLHASAAVAAALKPFDVQPFQGTVSVWHVTDCFLCVSCQLQTKKTSPSQKKKSSPQRKMPCLSMKYDDMHKWHARDEKVLECDQQKKQNGYRPLLSLIVSILQSATHRIPCSLVRCVRLNS